MEVPDSWKTVLRLMDEFPALRKPILDSNTIFRLLENGFETLGPPSNSRKTGIELHFRVFRSRKLEKRSMDISFTPENGFGVGKQSFGP